MTERDKYFVSPRTKRFIFLWASLLLLATFIPRWLIGLSQPKTHILSQKDAEINQNLEAVYKRTEEKRNARPNNAKFKKPAQKFDPNRMSESDWQNLGLSPKQAAVVVKFTKRGVYSMDDLSKIYVLSPEFIAVIEDSIVFPEKKPIIDDKELKSGFIRKVLNVNEATEEELTKLPGIGEYSARKIVEYRTRLGGFYQLEQLREIKILENNWDKWSGSVKVSGDIKKLNINKLSTKELSAHPYFTFKVANSVVKLREQKGTYQHLDELKESLLIDEALFEKIKPYVSLSDQ